jgi:protein-S-isoprenylcysteine O-methyltransferase Ste14
VFFGYYAHRFYYVRKVRHASGSVVRQPREAVGPVLLLFLSAVVIAAHAVAPRPLGWASLPLPEALRWTGLALAVAAFALLEGAQSALGRNWSLRVQLLKEHELVVRGPYRRVRHPMYTAGLLASVSVLLLSANWLVGGSWLVMCAWQFALRIPLEENLMTEQFGDAYRQYTRTTGRLIPRIRHRGYGRRRRSGAGQQVGRT